MMLPLKLIQIYILAFFALIVTTSSAADTTGGDDKFVTIVIRFDGCSYETGFSIRLINDDGTPGPVIFASYPGSYNEPAGTEIEEVIPLLPLMDEFDVQEYRVSFFDEYGDGIYFPGFYEIWYGPANEEEGTRIRRGSGYNFEERTHFFDPYVVFKGSDPSDQYPLGRCEGDCDNDSDCQANLVCYQRDANQEIPGCDGGLEDNSQNNYCTYSTYPIINIIGPNPSSPIGLCEGDCDNDDDCEGHLVCFHRDGGEAVPACFGGLDDNSRTDYCTFPNLKIVDSNPPSSPLGICEGDCDNDGECEGDLICFHRDGGEVVPGCAGGSDDNSRTDYCIIDPTA